jgi:hypothetical protein
MRKFFIQEFDFALSLEVKDFVCFLLLWSKFFYHIKKIYGQMITYSFIVSILWLFCSIFKIDKAGYEGTNQFLVCNLVMIGLCVLHVNALMVELVCFLYLMNFKCHKSAKKIAQP